MDSSTPLLLAANPDVSRFLKKIYIPAGDSDQCWLWQAGTDPAGYGQFHLKGKNIKAHRVSYMFFRGSIGDFNVCHSCDTPACCNPAHLWLGTDQANMDDKYQKGRGRHAKGEKHGTKTKPDAFKAGWARRNLSKVGRKKGTKIVLEPLVAGGKIKPAQRLRAIALASNYFTADEILRFAIDRGLAALEAEASERASVPLKENPADW
jgi:hypothetical protein